MASPALLLHVLLMSTASSTGYQHYLFYGGSTTFNPKGQSSHGAYEVELRHRQTVDGRYTTGGVCLNGDCGTETEHASVMTAKHSGNLTWRQFEVKTTRKLKTNLPFEMSWPDIKDSRMKWRMMTHIDLGTRSDTGESNRSPVITTPQVLRVTRNCPRTFGIPTFDPDGDRVRCRVPTNSTTYECSMCSLVNGFSLDQNSCSLTFRYSQHTGYHPIELVVEDFPNREISLSYSDGSYTIKRPLSGNRRKREVLHDSAVQKISTTAPTLTNATSGPTSTTTARTTTAAPTTSGTASTGAPNTSTAAPTTTTKTASTAAPTTTSGTASTGAPTASTAAPNTTSKTTTTAAPTTTSGTASTGAPTASTGAPTTTSRTASTGAQTTSGTTSTAAPTTTSGTASTAAPTTTSGTASTGAPNTTSGTASTGAPTTSTAAPTTTSKTTTTAAPTTSGTTSTAAPTTTSGTTSTAAPTTSGTAFTAAPTTTSKTTSTAAPTTSGTTSTAAPTTSGTTSTAAPNTTSGTTTTAAPTTTSGTTTTATPTTTSGTTSTAAPTTSGTTSTAAPTTTSKTTSTAAPTTSGTASTAAPTTTSGTASTATPTTTQHYRPSIAPLSKLPLQFSLYVDSHYAPSCLDGDYFPVFLSPTPANGANLSAYVNNTLEFKVKSAAQNTMIHDLIVTGPRGISKQKVSTGTYMIKWTPTENELNDYSPICFVSEARDELNQVYHSELRCVTAEVEYYEATVSCNETTITVEVAKTDVIRRNENILHLNDFTDYSCDLTSSSNASHLVAVMSLNCCGTRVEEDDDNIIFSNVITSADPDEIISRVHDVEIAFSCVYPKRANLTLGFTHKNPYAFRERGFGAFTFQFEFFETQLFRKQVNDSSYPVEVYLKQMIFMQIEETSSIPNTELFVESCKATPYDNPNSRISYTIIDNGCVRDKTVQIYPSSRSQFRFGMEAFEFIGAHEEVYVTCSVMLCESGVAGTRCSQGCLGSNSGNHRDKREAAAQTSRHSISQGPLHLAQSSDSRASGPSLTLGMNFIFIVGCLLICGAVIYRSRRTKAGYQALPTSDAE